MSNFGTNFRIFFLSTVVTKIIKAPKVSLTNREVAAPEIVWVSTRHGKVRCLITRPATGAPLNSGEKPPVYINIHGGAFLIGNPEQDTHLTRGIAGEVGAVVVNVDYTTAPKAKYPQAQEECYDVLKWASEASNEQLWDGSRISIGGGSAGAQIALGVLELTRQDNGPAVRSAVLVVPIVNMSAPAASYVSSYTKAMVSPTLVETMLAAYFPDESTRTEFMASPLLGNKEQFNSLPPLLVVSAEYDTLRPGIEQFVERLNSESVPVTYKEFKGQDHDFPLKATAGAEQKELAELMTSHLVSTLG